MIEGKPSATALSVALRRAAHQLLDWPLVLEDPLALRILGTAGRGRLDAHIMEERVRPAAARLRAFLAVRSRLAEDALAEAIAAGVTQYVVLGAGLDTFAYRNPHPQLHVFEVDAPATQAWKQARLREAQLQPPPNLTFAPTDFEREDVQDGLSRAGFDLARPAFFSWLGVVPYLTREAASSTLQFVGALPEESGIVFDYALPREALTPAEQLAFDELAARVDRTGESFRFFVERKALTAELSALGFRRCLDFDGPALNARYFDGRADGLKVGANLAHLMTAWR